MNFIKSIFKSKKRLILLAVILLVGFLVWRNFSSKKTEDLKTAKIEKGTVSQELVLSGEIQADEHASLNFLSSGELYYIGVEEGEEVKKGQILAKLDSTTAYQTFLQAEADLRRYDASLDNTYDQLQGHSNDESYTQIETRTIAETNKDKAYRNYVIAQKSLTNLSLKAPFDGIVAAITHPFNGINTSLAESQIEIVNPETIYFEVNADQTDVTAMKNGQKVKMVLDSFPDEELDGEVFFIGYTPKAGEVGTVYKVKIKLAKQLNSGVKLGMSGDARFMLSEKENVLFLPPNFIKADNSGKFINLEKKNNKKYVEVGVEGEDRVEITGDIKEGDIVYD